MAIDPTKQISGAASASHTTTVQQAHSRSVDSARIGKALTQGVNSSSKSLPETPGEKTGGLIFAKGSLKNLETKEERYKDKEGVFQTKTVYKATLTDGTVVEYEKQEPLRGKNGEYQQPQIRKNKDGSFDFEGLQHAVVTDTAKNDNYNIIGCDDILVTANERDDKDVIDNANLRLADGTIIENSGIGIAYNQGDKVADLFGNPSENPPQTKQHDGQIILDDDLMTDYLGTGKPTVTRGTAEMEYLENGRRRHTHTTEERTVSATYSHDGKKLSEDYVNAKVQVLSDGYRFATSPDGKTQWFFDPKGNPISKKEFQNRGLQ